MSLARLPGRPLVWRGKKRLNEAQLHFEYDNALLVHILGGNVESNYFCPFVYLFVCLSVRVTVVEQSHDSSVFIIGKSELLNTSSC